MMTWSVAWPKSNLVRGRETRVTRKLSSPNQNNYPPGVAKSMPHNTKGLKITIVLRERAVMYHHPSWVTAQTKFKERKKPPEITTMIEVFFDTKAGRRKMDHLRQTILGVSVHVAEEDEVAGMANNRRQRNNKGPKTDSTRSRMRVLPGVLDLPQLRHKALLCLLYTSPSPRDA